jgi:hypothetical protein
MPPGPGSGEAHRRWRRLERAAHIATILLGLLALAAAILSVVASWNTVAALNKVIQLSENQNITMNDMGWQQRQSADRLYYLMNDTMMIGRILLMQLCNDHPARLHRVRYMLREACG